MARLVNKGPVATQLRVVTRIEKSARTKLPCALGKLKQSVEADCENEDARLGYTPVCNWDEGICLGDRSTERALTCDIGLAHRRNR